MQQRRRRPPPPWERRSSHPRHPTGAVRRRWPRAYDGGEPRPGSVQRRYRREYDGERRAEARRGLRRSAMLETLRQSPVRNGLIGLAVAGAAAPIAVSRYQQALRTDPSHERVATMGMSPHGIDDSSVASAWGAMETGRSAALEARESTIEEKLREYSAYDLTREMAEDIYDIAVEADIDPDIAFGLVRAESSFRNTSTSRVGAIGLTQLMPKTAAWLSPGTSLRELRDPETNLRIGFRYLRQLIDKYDGNENLALTAYNRGPGTVDRVLDRGGNPDNGYADFVRTGDVGEHEG